jgi:hypothetical protein
MPFIFVVGGASIRSVKLMCHGAGDLDVARAGAAHAG